MPYSYCEVIEFAREVSVKHNKCHNNEHWSFSGDLSRAELMMMTIADVIKQLVEAHEEGKDINLNK